jgi:hypothetical protein
MPQPYVSLPRGSILYIEAVDLLATPPGSVKSWNKVSEHNRSAFQMGTDRIEKIIRTSNGTLRKNHIADKKKFQVSWDMLPSYRTLTVDGGWGAEDIRSFYDSVAGNQSFNIRINLAKTGSDQSLSGYESYTVVFSSCDFTVVKRGLQPHWSVSLSMDEV